MNVEFSYAPTSGQFEEKQFDLNTVWRSADWCWVKFSLNDSVDWYGSFRGTAKRIAYAKELGLAAVLTSDCLYIVNASTKDVLFSDPQTNMKEMATDSFGSKFILADWTSLLYIDSDMVVKEIPCYVDCDNIKFGSVYNNKLELEFEEIPTYQIKKGFLDLQTWELEYTR